MKIAVVGSRKFKDEEFVGKILSSELGGHDTLISGGAIGVDTWAEEVIPILNSGLANYEIKKIIFKPDWNDLSQPGAIIKINKHGEKYDARAGFRRNKLIIDEADKVIAFWDGKSKGTKHSIDLAIKANKPLDIYVR